MSAPFSDHPRDAEALDYVLGVGNAAERAAFLRDAAADPALRGAVAEWEQRLAPLSAATAPVEPDAAGWDRIAARLDGTPGAAPPLSPEGEIVQLRRTVRTWRRVASGAALLAASLLAALALPSLRPAERPGALVAVVNRSGELPALIVRVDPERRSVQVRSVTSETPAGHSLELWSLAGSAGPRSLGLVGGGLTRISLPADIAEPSLGATLAVSVEPEGGSRTGLPTGPVIYTGRLVAENP